MPAKRSLSSAKRKSHKEAISVAFDPSATLGSTQESARSHLIGGMVRPGGDVVLSLRAYVQLPQHVSDELLHVLMATVVEGDARALSVGQRSVSPDPIRVDDDGLIVRLRELHECHTFYGSRSWTLSMWEPCFLHAVSTAYMDLACQEHR